MSISPQGQNLIFLISQPRSGSTLLQYVLAGHTEICTTPEPWIMLHPVYALRMQGIKTEYFSNRSHTALDDFLRIFPEGEEAYYNAIRAFAAELYNRTCQHLESPR